MRYLKYLFIFFSITFISCSNDSNVSFEAAGAEFKSSYQALTHSNKMEYPIYIVLPRAGCGGCISDAEDYVLSIAKHKDGKKIGFILTDFGSEKILKARFGKLINSKNVFVDKENIFAANTMLKSIYPTVYMFNNSDLIKVSSFSPQMNAVNDIKQFLMNIDNVTNL